MNATQPIEPKQALEYLEFESYDVVLTDISMPGLGGLEVLRRITQRHTTTPVIVISGQVDAIRMIFWRWELSTFLPSHFYWKKSRLLCRERSIIEMK